MLRNWGDPEFNLLQVTRTISIDKPIDDDVANLVIAQCAFLDDAPSEKEIRVLVNSPGGTARATLSIYDTLRSLGSEVTTICTGTAAGSAAMLVAAGSPGKRFILPHASILLKPIEHGAMPVTTANIEDVEREVRRTADAIIAIFSELTGRSPEEIAHDIEHQKLLDAGDAVAYGLADAILEKAPIGRA
jgi:ATP-dependent Clp protease protease subunit